MISIWLIICILGNVMDIDVIIDIEDLFIIIFNGDIIVFSLIIKVLVFLLFNMLYL